MYPVVLLFGVAVAAGILVASGAALTADMVAKLLVSLLVFGLLLAFLMTALRPPPMARPLASRRLRVRRWTPRGRW